MDGVLKLIEEDLCGISLKNNVKSKRRMSGDDVCLKVFILVAVARNTYG